MLILVLLILFTSPIFSQENTSSEELSEENSEANSDDSQKIEQSIIKKVDSKFVYLSVTDEIKTKIKGNPARSQIVFSDSDQTEVIFTYRGWKTKMLRLELQSPENYKAIVGTELEFFKILPKKIVKEGGLEIFSLREDEKVFGVKMGNDEEKSFAKDKEYTISTQHGPTAAKVRIVRGKNVFCYIDDQSYFSELKVGDIINILPHFDPSQANRHFKPIMVGFIWHPIADFLLEYGLASEYQASPELAFGVDLHIGNKKFASYSSSNVQGEAQGSALLLNFTGRYFFGNSFNLLSGIGYRQANVGVDIETTFGVREKVSSEISLSGFHIPIAVGNHWSMDNGFHIGVDWLKYHLNISGSSSISTSSENIQNSDVQKINKDIVDTGKELANISPLTIDVLIGWRF